MSSIPTRVALAWLAAGLLGAALGCAERLADEDSPELEPACMALPARGYWDDGSTKMIVDESGFVATVCMCMTEEEGIEKVYLDEMNDRAYEECKRVEFMYWDFDWTECDELYEAGAWKYYVWFARGDSAEINRRGLTCEEVRGCSLTDRSRPAAPLLLALAALLLRRRRQRAQKRTVSAG